MLYTVSYRGVTVFWESQVVDVKVAIEFIEQKSHIHDQPQTSFLIKKIPDGVCQTSECHWWQLKGVYSLWELLVNDWGDL